MKFDRQYEPAILVYRETRAPGRLLLRLGRLHDDGSYTLEETAPIEKSYTFATHILTKDTRGLLARLRKCLQDFSVDAAGNLDAVVIDYPALQAALQNDLSGRLAAELETLWGAPALEAILALPVLTTREQRRKIAGYLGEKDDKPEKQTNGYPQWLAYAIGSFLFLIVIPGIFFFVLRPEQFQTVQRAARGVLFEYAENSPGLASDISSGENDIDPELTPAELAMAAKRAELREEVRKAKQALYIAANFGHLDETFSATRILSPLEDEAAPAPGAAHELPGVEQAPSPGVESPAAGVDAGHVDQEKQKAGDAAQANNPDVASHLGAETEKSSTLPLPEAPVQEMAGAFGFPIDMAGMRLLRIDTSPAGGSDEGEIRGATAVYDIRRGPAVIFEADPADMQGLAGATDEAVRDICSAMGSPVTDIAAQSETSSGSETPDPAQDSSLVDPEIPDVPQQPLVSGNLENVLADPEGPALLREATLSIQAGRSDIAGVVITPDTCAGASYNVFTLFEFIPEDPEADL